MSHAWPFRSSCTDRTAVGHVLPQYMPVSKQIAALVNLTTFPSDLNAVHLQRVADLMFAGGDSATVQRRILARPVSQ